MDKFEKIVKQSVEHYEVPYSEDAWKSLSKKMGPEKGLATKWTLGLSAAAIVIICGAIWFNTPSADDSNSELSMIDQTEKNTITPRPNNVNQNNEITAPVSANESDEPRHIDEPIHIDEPNVQSDAETGSESESSDSGTDDAATENPNDGLHPVDALSNTGETPELQSSQSEGDLVIEEETVDYSKFDLKVITDQDKICYGKKVLFTPSIPKIKALYQWDLGDGTIEIANFVDHIYEKPGTYQVKLQLLDPKTKEVVNTAPVKEVEVFELPQNHINYEMERSIIPTVYFSQNIADGEQIIWEIAGLHRASTSTFSYEFKKKGNYLVKCTIVNEFGCSTTKSEKINIEEDYNLLAPNTFTPNGDTKNETFIPKALLVNNLPFTMTIYDKSGNLVFQTTDTNIPWDGLYTKDLLPAPDGSYIWIVKLTNDNGEEEVYQGTILLMRP